MLLIENNTGSRIETAAGKMNTQSNFVVENVELIIIQIC